jgi:hypothetical protein
MYSLLLPTRRQAEKAARSSSIKPLFAYLISTLCPGKRKIDIIPWHFSLTFQSSGLLAGQTSPLDLGITPLDLPTQSQVPAAMLLSAVAELCHDQQRSNKLQSSLPVHRVLVILLANNPARYVVLPCLDIIATILCSASGDSFRGKFDEEGGFELLNTCLPVLWDEEIQSRGMLTYCEARRCCCTNCVGVDSPILSPISRGREAP